MSAPTWMPFYVGDYLADTMHLTCEQHGCYVLLICAYWRNGGPLPDDDEQFSAIAKLMAKAWLCHRPVMAKFFRIENGHWHHKRIDAEISRTRGWRENRRNAGKKGAASRWNDSSANGGAIAEPLAEPWHSQWQTDGKPMAYLQSQSEGEVILPSPSSGVKETPSPGAAARPRARARRAPVGGDFQNLSPREVQTAALFAAAEQRDREEEEADEQRRQQAASAGGSGSGGSEPVAGALPNGECAAERPRRRNAGLD